MIEIGYDINIKDINRIKKYKNPTLDIYRNKLNDNSNYKTFLSKTQFNNLLKNNSIKYKLTNSKKNKNIMIGDGIGSLISMILPFVRSVVPKVLGTVGLSSIGALTNNAINKKMNKNYIIKLSDKQVNDINKNLDMINQKYLMKKLHCLKMDQEYFQYYYLC